MCAGLPVVVSRDAGCVPDLVCDGVNGYTPYPGDIEGLANALELLINDEDLRRRQSEASPDANQALGLPTVLRGGSPGGGGA